MVHISYDSEELIKEVKNDVVEFGENEKVYVFLKKIENGKVILTNYDFITKEKPLSKKELQKNEYLEIWELKDVLNQLNLQNDIFY